MKHIMTEEEIRHRIKAAEAFLRGGECEGQFMDGEWKPVREEPGEREWSGNAFFDPTIKIRIKAPPTFIPLDQADWANGPWWVAKNVKPDEWLAVIGLHPNGITVALGIECKIEYWSDVYLLNCCIRSRTCLPDSWEVCGKEVQS